MDKILFSIGRLDISAQTLIALILSLVLAWTLNRLGNKWLIPRVIKDKPIDSRQVGNIKWQLTLLVILIFSLLILYILNIDLKLFETADFTFGVSHFIKGLIIFQGARIIDWLINNIYVKDYYLKRDTNQPSPKKKSFDYQEIKVNRLIQYIVSTLAILFLLNLFNADLTLFQRQIKGETFHFGISTIFISVLIFLVAQLVVVVFIQLVLYTVYKRRHVDTGAQYAINQLLKYIIYVFAFIMVLDNFGLDITIILGGAAALLVGIGLGLQQTFNDFISGLVLLFERSVAVGDVLQIGEVVGVVKKIGLRASTIETIGNITILLPNSKLVNESVTNWTHFEEKVRFDIAISAAYGSDTLAVKQELLAAVNDNTYVLSYPEPFVRFEDFGSSSLDFKVYFFSKNVLYIEDVKSDIRFDIDKRFKAIGIEIPFPQQDVWLRNKDPKA